MNETFQSLFGARLKEERKALGLSQEEAAIQMGVTREHWGRCERGLAVPGGEVLAALATAGADVIYILTGQGGKASPVALSAEEQVLLSHYREASKEVRRAALGALLGAQSGGMNFTNSAAGAVQVGHAGGKVTVKKGR